MANVCEKCGKGPSTGHNVSHSVRRTNRRFMPNLVKKKIAGERVKVCMKCLKSAYKVA